MKKWLKVYYTILGYVNIMTSLKLIILIILKQYYIFV